MRHWLMKSEPSVYGIARLERDGKTGWEGVRNYQARNHLRDDIKAGDLVLFYHSSAEPTGVAGVAEVSREAYPDPLQFDRKSDYFDEKAKKDAPTWFAVELKFVERFPQVVTLETLKSTKGLDKMLVTRRGMRPSVLAVTPGEFEIVRKLGKGKS